MTRLRAAPAAAVARAAVAVLAAPPPAGAQTPEEVDRVVVEAVRDRYAAIRRCHDKALARDPRAGGAVALILEVAPGGRVARTIVALDEVGHPDTAACLRAVFDGATLPGFPDGAEVGVPLRLRPPPRQVAVRLADAPAHALPGGQARVLLDARTAGARRAALSRLTLAPGAKVPLHVHDRACEVVYLLSGRGRMRGAAGAWREFGPGAAAFVPAGVPHAFEAGDAPVEALQLYAPPGPERRFYDPSATGGMRPVPDGTPGRAGRDAVFAAPGTWAASLAGGASLRVAIGPASTGARELSLAEVHLPPGSVVPVHAHEHGDEWLYILSGAGEIAIGDQTLDLEPDRAYFVPQGTPHRLSVTGDRPLRALQAFTPAGPESSPDGGLPLQATETSR